MYSQLTLEELKERIGKCYDPDLLVEILEINTKEILDSFEEKLLDNIYKFQDVEDEVEGFYYINDEEIERC